jgi:hypothetical protein
MSIQLLHFLCKSRQSSMNIGQYSPAEYKRLIESFHGSVAPGMLIGGIMVDAALERLNTTQLYDAICETSSCLPPMPFNSSRPVRSVMDGCISSTWDVSP